MANLMAYPSAAQGLSEGLQSGIQLGIQARQQREAEDRDAWQKQKFEEQQALNKAVQATEPLKSILTGKYPKATKARAYESLQKIWSPLGVEFPEMDFNNEDKVTEAMKKAAAIFDGRKTVGWEKTAEALNDWKAELATKLDAEEFAQIKPQIESMEKMVTEGTEGENFQKGIEAQPNYPNDPSAAIYFSKAGKAGENVSKFLPKPKEEKEVSGGNDMENFLGRTFKGFYTDKNIRKSAYDWLSTPEGSKAWEGEQKRLAGIAQLKYPPIYNVVPTSEGLVPFNARTGQPSSTPIGGKPLPEGQIKQGADIGTLMDTMGRIKSTYKPNYVGVVGGRYGGIKEKLVGVPEEQAMFYSDVRDMQDALLRARSGAQINEQEYKRLTNFLPEPNLPPKTFEARMKRFEIELNSIISNRQKQLGGYGKNYKGSSQMKDTLGIR